MPNEYIVWEFLSSLNIIFVLCSPKNKNKECKSMGFCSFLFGGDISDILVLFMLCFVMATSLLCALYYFTAVFVFSGGAAAVSLWPSPFLFLAEKNDQCDWAKMVISPRESLERSPHRSCHGTGWAQLSTRESGSLVELLINWGAEPSTIRLLFVESCPCFRSRGRLQTFSLC